jgi:hypothetical protein
MPHYPDVPKHQDIVTAIKALSNYNSTFVNAMVALMQPLMEQTSGKHSAQRSVKRDCPLRSYSGHRTGARQAWGELYFEKKDSLMVNKNVAWCANCKLSFSQVRDLCPVCGTTLKMKWSDNARSKGADRPKVHNTKSV